DCGGVVLERGELRAHADGQLDAIEVRETRAEVVRVAGQAEALAIRPFAEHEGAGARGMTREVLFAHALDGLAVHHRGERHGELVEEQRVDRGEGELDPVRSRGADAADLPCPAGRVVGGALDAGEELRPLRVNRWLEEALERVLDVGGGPWAPPGEPDVP